MKIVIIEDDFLIVAQIQECVERLGHEVLSSFDNARSALDFIEENRPEFVFMDIELKGALDGLQCANILQNKYSISSVFVTSYDETEIIQESMDAKPLNFLPKPFEDSNIEAVVALAEITLRREKPKSDSSVISLGEYILNVEYKILKREGVIVKLTDKELLLVSLLFKNIGNVVSTQRIDEYVYENNLSSDDALRRLVSRTRDKLVGLQIKAEPKQGYFITFPQTMA